MRIGKRYIASCVNPATDTDLAAAGDETPECSICMRPYDTSNDDTLYTPSDPTSMDDESPTCRHPVTLQCGHMFGYACLSASLKQSMTCPMCRGHVKPLPVDRFRLLTVRLSGARLFNAFEYALLATTNDNRDAMNGWKRRGLLAAFCEITFEMQKACGVCTVSEQEVRGWYETKMEEMVDDGDQTVSWEDFERFWTNMGSWFLYRGYGDVAVRRDLGLPWWLVELLDRPRRNRRGER